MKIVKIVVGAVIAILIIVFFYAKSEKISPLSMDMHEPVNLTDGKAMQGYDPIAYFIAGEPRKGYDSIALFWNDAKWLFESEQNKFLFKNNPAYYAPQFGGYCTFAVSSGFTAEIDPEVWEIREDQLYLFSSEDVKKELSMPVIRNAKENWKK